MTAKDPAMKSLPMKTVVKDSGDLAAMKTAMMQATPPINMKLLVIDRRPILSMSKTQAM
jgi:hypothetical protein